MVIIPPRQALIVILAQRLELTDILEQFIDPRLLPPNILRQSLIALSQLVVVAHHLADLDLKLLVQDLGLAGVGDLLFEVDDLILQLLIQLLLQSILLLVQPDTLLQLDNRPEIVLVLID